MPCTVFSNGTVLFDNWQWPFVRPNRLEFTQTPSWSRDTASWWQKRTKSTKFDALTIRPLETSLSEWCPSVIRIWSASLQLLKLRHREYASWIPEAPKWKRLGMFSHKMPIIITIFGHVHFKQIFDIFHEKNDFQLSSILVHIWNLIANLSHK